MKYHDLSTDCILPCCEIVKNKSDNLEWCNEPAIGFIVGADNAAIAKATLRVMCRKHLSQVAFGHSLIECESCQKLYQFSHFILLAKAITCPRCQRRHCGDSGLAICESCEDNSFGYELKEYLQTHEIEENGEPVSCEFIAVDQRGEE